MFLNLRAFSRETHFTCNDFTSRPVSQGLHHQLVRRSLLLRLTLFRSEERVADTSFLRFVRLHSTHARASVMSSMTPQKAGRIIGDISSPSLIGYSCGNILLEQIRGHQLRVVQVSRNCDFLRLNHPQGESTHLPGNTKFSPNRQASWSKVFVI